MGTLVLMKNTATATTTVAIALALGGAIRRISGTERPEIEWDLPAAQIVGIVMIVLMVVAIIGIGIAEEIERRR